MPPVPAPSLDGLEGIDEKDKELFARGADFEKYETGYSTEHATKPSTIAMCVMADPVAMLAW